MQHARHSECKWRYGRIKLGAIFCRYLIAAMHSTNRRIKHRAAGVLKMLTWLEQRLHPYHTEAAHFLNAAGCIGNNPMTADKLCGHAACIGDGDGVRKYVAILLDVRLLRYVGSFYSHRKFIAFIRCHSKYLYEIMPVVGELGAAE